MLNQKRTFQPGNLWENRKNWHLQLNFTPRSPEVPSPPLLCPVARGRAEAEAVLVQYFQSSRCKKHWKLLQCLCCSRAGHGNHPEATGTIPCTAALVPGLSWSYSKACLVKLLRVIDYWGRMLIILESMERLLVSMFFLTTSIPQLILALLWIRERFLVTTEGIDFSGFNVFLFSTTSPFPCLPQREKRDTHEAGAGSSLQVFI